MNRLNEAESAWGFFNYVSSLYFRRIRFTDLIFRIALICAVVTIRHKVYGVNN